MADSSSFALPIRIVLRFALTILLLWLLVRFLPQYLSIGGGWAALPVVAALVTLLNMFARPILKVLTLPLKLFMTLAAIVLVNGVFLWILEKIADKFDPQTATFAVEGGVGGWIVVALALGLGNWVIHHLI